MHTRPIKDYFLQGFILVNKSLDIFLILYCIELLAQALSHQPKTPVGTLLSLFALILIWITAGFGSSVPLFLMKKHKKELSYREMWQITIQNAGRLILPLISLVVLFILFLVAFVACLFLLHLERMITFKDTLIYLQHWNPISFAFALSASFFSFTSIFFSVEKFGLIESIKKSVQFSWKNKKFLIPILFYDGTRYTVATLLPPQLLTGIGHYIYYAIVLYLSLIVIAATLIYYKHIKIY